MIVMMGEEFQLTRVKLDEVVKEAGKVWGLGVVALLFEMKQNWNYFDMPLCERWWNL